MRKILIPAILCCGVLGAGAARAATFDFTYSGASVLNFGTQDTASGTLTIGSLDPANSQNSPAGYDITGITGTYDGSAITGLLALNQCCGTPGNDNILYSGGAQFLDGNGLGFTDAVGKEVNIFATGYANDPYQVTIGPPSTGTTASYGSFTISPAPQSVPEPSSLILLGTGLLGLLFIIRGRLARKMIRTSK